MKLTKKKAIELHRHLWDWCYHHPSKRKEAWPRWVENGGDIERVWANCFACEICQSCSDCPFTWPVLTAHAMEPCSNSYFGQWSDDTRSPKTRKKYAKLIRDLKERK